jgi:hypothetical protein
MNRLLLLIPFVLSLSHASGTYDGYFFDDTQEKYSLHFVNSALTFEMTGAGLDQDSAMAILDLRPITSLSMVESNVYIDGKDMLYIRQRSAAVTIPDQSIYSDMNTTLGITNRDKNFFSALSGTLFGFSFLIVSLFIASRR